MKTRFNQPGYKVIRNAEEQLVKECNQTSEITVMNSHS